MNIESEILKDRHLHELNGRVSEGNEWENLSQYLLYLRHKKAYLYASSLCQSKIVLDYGCGNGYGSFLLADHSTLVKAVDINKDVISICQKKYQHPNLSFQLIKPGERIPFEDNYFDVAVSFQVIEHVRDVPNYLNQLKRVLKEDGVLIITTPNRKQRLYPFQRPKNPYHLREYSLRQLRKQLSHHFKNVKILGINGNEEINNIEYNRIKKSIKSFILPATLKSWLKKNLFKSLRKENPISAEKKFINPIKKKVLDGYSVGDYSILEEDVEKGLDFLAILGNK